MMCLALSAMLITSSFSMGLFLFVTLFLLLGFWLRIRRLTMLLLLFLVAAVLIMSVLLVVIVVTLLGSFMGTAVATLKKFVFFFSILSNNLMPMNFIGNKRI